MTIDVWFNHDVQQGSDHVEDEDAEDYNSRHCSLRSRVLLHIHAQE
jgi:hypothetical protein